MFSAWALFWIVQKLMKVEVYLRLDPLGNANHSYTFKKNFKDKELPQILA